MKFFSGTNRIDSWKSNGRSEGKFENITKSDSNFVPTIVDHHVLPNISFNRPSLINNILRNKPIVKKFIPDISLNRPYLINNILRTKTIVKKFKHRFYIK